MKVNLGGTKFEVLTPGEAEAIVADTLTRQLQQFALPVEHTNVKASPITLPGYGGSTLRTGAAPVGPRPGRVWAVQRVSVYGGLIHLHTDDGSPSTYVATAGGNPGGGALFGRTTWLVRPGQTLYIVNSSINGIRATVNLEVLDVAAADAWRL